MEDYFSNFLHLYIIRHAETDLNRFGIIQGGGIDVDINEHGKWQAEQFWQHYKHISFDAVYCSTLKRTHQTVEKFIQKSPWVEYLSELNEISWGYLEGKKPTQKDISIYHNLIAQWQSGNLDAKIEGGESAISVQNRLKKALKKIHYNHAKGNILICTHGRALRILLCTLFNYNIANMDLLFTHQNTCLNHVIFTGSAYIAVRINDVSHLKGCEF
ncbi:MAG: histidine phosphatase family protein [Bacteroidia bacterium]|nr:histidine phosphatase family protein [Bacteroidia bacterium]MDW8302311.1 histidine phosphatase family protein [Bacteroidia bacterium]